MASGTHPPHVVKLFWCAAPEALPLLPVTIHPYSVRDLYKLTGSPGRTLAEYKLWFVIGTIEGMGRHCLCPVPKENVLVTQGLAHSFEEHL